MYRRILNYKITLKYNSSYMTWLKTNANNINIRTIKTWENCVISNILCGKYIDNKSSNILSKVFTQ